MSMNAVIISTTSLPSVHPAVEMEEKTPGRHCAACAVRIYGRGRLWHYTGLSASPGGLPHLPTCHCNRESFAVRPEHEVGDGVRVIAEQRQLLRPRVEEAVPLLDEVP